MERLATDTAPRALTQRRTWLRSREKDDERGGRDSGNESRGEAERRAASAFSRSER
ncbi:protein of unknown function (plasmid) [Paraburkholderia dioscoreae]|uniref:Uncharacterized protein n=1 Tax=Paraburkholderia dioscoreae TaxID=2604047 RepID=A0A5Q4ZI61_9BURK|nr:protein of unknown function [Paraburkholderia dioscoreae]